MLNIINLEAITDYLAGFFPDDSVCRRHLQTALGQALKKETAALTHVPSLPRTAPAWLAAKWPDGGPYYRFAPNAHLTDRIRHVADWIAGAVRENDAWLAKADAQGRPQKLLKLGSLAQAEAEANKAMRQKNDRMAARLIPDGEGESAVMAMPNGFRIVQLVSLAALEHEGVGMGHCIGQGAYDGKLLKEARQFFSLRDDTNKPHATFEINPATNNLLQCKGKENKPPVMRYMPYVQAFVRDRGLHLKTDTRYTNLIEQRGEYYDIMHLPDTFHSYKNLDLSGTPITRLPIRLTLGGGGNLDISHTAIAVLPDHLEIKGNLRARHTAIQKLPSHLIVKGDLDLSHTPIHALPDDLHVGGMLDISYTAIKTLPKGLRVGGTLIVKGTEIDTIPPDAEIGEDLRRFGHMSQVIFGLRQPDFATRYARHGDAQRYR